MANAEIGYTASTLYSAIRKFIDENTAMWNNCVKYIINEKSYDLARSFRVSL